MKRILITEDDPLMAVIYRDTFEREGFSAEIAEDGNIALQRLKGNPPDLVLLDLMMPGLNGVEVLKYIRAQESTSTLPVIVMSNAFAGPLGQEAAAAGATRIFAKNAFGPRRVVNEIRSLLGPSPESAEATSPNGDATKSLVELRKSITTGLAERIGEIRDRLQDIAQEGSLAKPTLLLDLHRAIHQLTDTVSAAGFNAMAQMACALDTMAKEMQGNPLRINPSSLRTASQGVEVLAELSERTSRHLDEGIAASLILVVDDEAVARETTCTALERANLRAVSVDDPALALKLAEENRFDLIFMDVQMPRMNGFEVCRKLEETASNSDTPVIIVTSMNDTQTRIRFNVSGAIDFIGKPIWLTELGVKALTHLLRTHPQMAR